MDIGKLCTREVIGIAAQASVREAAIRMCEEHVGSLVAITDDDPPKVVGMVTDRDLALDVVGRDDGGEGLRVGDIAKSPPLAVPSSASLSEAVQAMNQARVRRLLVVDDDGGVVGIVAAEDLMAALSEELAGLVGALRGSIEREKRERKVAHVPAGVRPVFPMFGAGS